MSTQPWQLVCNFIAFPTALSPHPPTTFSIPTHYILYSHDLYRQARICHSHSRGATLWSFVEGCQCSPGAAFKNLERSAAPPPGPLPGVWGRRAAGRGFRGLPGTAKAKEDSRAAVGVGSAAEVAAESDSMDAGDVSSDEEEEWRVRLCSAPPPLHSLCRSADG